jgi:hypothetical protein
MKKCALNCYIKKVNCENTECRLYIDYPEDLNCTSVAIQKHGSMTLHQIGDRHGISIVRTKQILDSTLNKLKKTLLKENTI